MPDLSSFLDMNYFWWTFGQVIKFGAIFLVILVAIKAGGQLLETIIQSVRKMGR